MQKTKINDAYRDSWSQCHSDKKALDVDDKHYENGFAVALRLAKIK